MLTIIFTILVSDISLQQILKAETMVFTSLLQNGKQCVLSNKYNMNLYNDLFCCMCVLNLMFKIVIYRVWNLKNTLS